MLTYYALYRESDRQTPAGIIVSGYADRDGPPGERPWHALRWSHRSRAWVYDPEGAGRRLEDEEYDDRNREIDRATAERITPAITNGEPLPDEETIYWIFQWRGNPPQTED